MHETTPDSPSDASGPVQVAVPSAPAMPPYALILYAADDEYLRLDSSKVSLADCRLHGWLAPVMLLCKLGFVPSGFASTQQPPVNRLAPFRTATAGVDETTRRALEDDRDLDALEAKGFTFAAMHEVWNPVAESLHVLTSFGHPTLPIAARVRLVCHVIPFRVMCVCLELLTVYEDGTFAATMVDAPEFHGEPEGCTVTKFKLATVEELLKAHMQVISRRAESVRSLPASSTEQVVAIGDQVHARLIAFLRGRRLLVPVKSEELASKVRSAQERMVTIQAHPRHAYVHLMVLQLLNHPSNGIWNAVLLLGSLVVFAVIGIPGWSASTLLLLIPVLLVHELGHYVAMKIFGYRNIKMFFIPGIGAAVSGRHFNIEGWKRAVCDLAGPLPGVIFGVAAYAAGARWHVPILSNLGAIFAVINGANLLPFLPLDGGRVFHAVLFCRHVAMEAAAGLVGGIALMIAAISTSNVLLGAASIFLFVSIPGTTRLRRMVLEVRAKGVPVDSPDANSIPGGVIDAIADTVIARSPARRPPVAIAREVIGVFEMLNARPPGVAVSFLLIAVQFGALAVSAIPALHLFHARTSRVNATNPAQNPPRPESVRTLHQIP